MANKIAIVLYGGVLKELQDSDALTATEIITASIPVDNLSIGTIDSFIHLRKEEANQWHTHPNDLMLDTIGNVEIGDPQEFGNKTMIRVHDDGPAIIWLNSRAGVISIGDVENVVDGTLLVVDAGNDEIKFTAAKFGAFGATPVAKPTVTGSRGGNAALASLLTALQNLGLIVDSTS